MGKSPIEIAAELCRTFEGCRLKPYICPAGVPTIGYGSTFDFDGKPVTLKHPPITKEDAEELLQRDLLSFLNSVYKYCPNLTNHPAKAGAILDFVYNLGAGRLKVSTLRKKILEEDWYSARTELLKWNKGGGKVLLGLTKRRQAEAALL